MPLLQMQTLRPNCHLALWDIRENEQTLLEMLREAGIYDSDIRSGNETHRKQKLAIKLMLYGMKGFKDNVFYDEHGKPHLNSEKENHISISHSFDKVALLYSKDNFVGVDIELIKDKVHKIKDKFLKSCELPSTITTDFLYVSWCAKEALYKYYGKKGVSLKNDILLHPFDYQEQGGLLKADILPASLFNLTVSYERIGEYMLAYLY